MGSVRIFAANDKFAGFNRKGIPYIRGLENVEGDRQIGCEAVSENDAPGRMPGVLLQVLLAQEPQLAPPTPGAHAMPPPLQPGLNIALPPRDPVLHGASFTLLSHAGLTPGSWELSLCHGSGP